VIELAAARIARSREEFVRDINASLEHPEEGAGARRQLVDLEVGVPVGEASARVAEMLTGIAGGANS